MIKKAIILPYFGNFPSYFYIWLRSCRNNDDYDWLIFTDQELADENYGNIKVFPTTFDELKIVFQKKFDFPIVLNRPYKLCDYKPYYGFLFEDYLTGYDFWGYCDCDVIFGRLSNFLTEDLFQKYDKILRTGHLSLIRNTQTINTNFLKFETYKMVLTSPVIYGYDESICGYHLGFAGELLQSGYKFYQNEAIVADIDFRQYTFHIISDKQLPGVVLYENGIVSWLVKEKDQFKKAEMIYAHFQKRKLDMKCHGYETCFIIYPNAISEFSGQLSINNEWLSNENHADYYDKWKERKNNLFRDLKRFAYEPRKLEALFYRFTRRKFK